MEEKVMKQRIKHVMDPAHDLVGEMQRSMIIYYLKEYYGKSHKQSPTSLIDIKIMVDNLPAEQLEYIYKQLESYIDHALKNEVCPTCKRPVFD